MITTEMASRFAAHWIDAWNSHDIEKIIEHYTADVDFMSPLVAKIMDKADGRIEGKAALKDYFFKGLKSYPELKFELYEVFAGVDSLVLYYKSVSNLLAAEVFVLNEQGLVKTCYCNYKEV